jgi:dTDP-4-dehydrorhamnose 3,5-epimerase-like enzyme
MSRWNTSCDFCVGKIQVYPDRRGWFSRTWRWRMRRVAIAVWGHDALLTVVATGSTPAAS